LCIQMPPSLLYTHCIYVSDRKGCAHRYLAASLELGSPSQLPCALGGVERARCVACHWLGYRSGERPGDCAGHLRYERVGRRWCVTPSHALRPFVMWCTDTHSCKFYIQDNTGNWSYGQHPREIWRLDGDVAKSSGSVASVSSNLEEYGPKSPVRSVNWCPHSSRLAIGSEDCKTTVVEVRMAFKQLLQLLRCVNSHASNKRTGYAQPTRPRCTQFR
jgi:hypothetical protein